MTANLRATYAPLLTAAAMVGIVAAVLRVPPTWLLLWEGPLLLLLALVARWSPVRSAAVAGALGMAAVALWPVPLVWESGSWLEACGAAAFWALPAFGAVLVEAATCAARRA